MIDLRGYLATHGVNTIGWDLHAATDISADGSVITGFGTFRGENATFLVTGVPEPAGFGILGLCVMTLLRRRRGRCGNREGSAARPQDRSSPRQGITRGFSNHG